MDEDSVCRTGVAHLGSSGSGGGEVGVVYLEHRGKVERRGCKGFNSGVVTTAFLL